MRPRPTMVFHVPQVVDPDPRVGSSERVTRMVEAFEGCGYSVALVSGHSAERAARMREVRRMVRAGAPIEFVYAEATTNPTALTDPHHLPIRPLADLRFLAFLRRHQVPIGLFYRDVHWQFDFYRAVVPRPKRLAARAFYLFDLYWYRWVLNVLFLPSAAMAAQLPGWRRDPRVVELPPGSKGVPTELPSFDAGLRLFYVGSIAPPLYDIWALIDAVNATPGVSLTVCCPASQAGLVGHVRSMPNIDIVHEHGDSLIDRYRCAHVACLVYPPHPYRDFSMPIKLFEALGAGRPVLVSGGREVERFVRTTGVGWVVDLDSVAEVLGQLRDDPAAVRVAAERAGVAASRNTWVDRARSVARVLAPGSRGAVTASHVGTLLDEPAERGLRLD